MHKLTALTTVSKLVQDLEKRYPKTHPLVKSWTAYEQKLNREFVQETLATVK